MYFDELKEKAASLPMAPGVYLMRDKTNTVIYVGKAKKLKNRVSQYFVDTVSHSPKTRMMVSKIHQFDVIIAASEFEALILECSLIKRHMPKYNILLKDDKGYPYIRLDMDEAYPRITIANKILNDKASYFGPYGSRAITHALLKAVFSTFNLPTCSKNFPKDIGKDRPCLNYHMNQCEGWCQKNKDCAEYRKRIEQVMQMLQGNYRQVASEIKQQMLDAAEDMNFELAANLRDRLKAVESLGQKQLVTAGNLSDTDVIGFYQNMSKACFVVLHFSNGNLLDKDFEIFNSADEPDAAVGTLIAQFYLNRGYAPKNVLLPFELEDALLLEQLLEQNYGKKPKIRVPLRGNNVKLVELAKKNAEEEVERITSKEERVKGILSLLGKMLCIPTPRRIESFDISNISGTDIVASMVVYVDGKPKKDEYKKFAIKDLENQNDYVSMHQVIARRFTHFKNSDLDFGDLPDLLLIDGGAAHAQTAQSALDMLGISIPIFGMVKNDKHHTRALVTPRGEEIHIDSQQIIFSFIGSIQEETHRFAISYHKHLRSKRLQYSELDAITGIGPKRKQDLLKKFKSISGIKNASLDELKFVLPTDAANSVYTHFHSTEKGG